MAMNDAEREIGHLRLGLTAETVATAIIIVWGLAYLAVAAVKTGLVGNLPTVVSVAVLVLLGAFQLWIDGEGL